MERLVVTIAIGEYYRRMGELTHPLIRRYAERVGADFECITDIRLAQTTPHWEKFRLAEFLKRYERVLYLDTDLIVRGDCPDLFTLVPETHIGAFDESAYYTDARARMESAARAYGYGLELWDGRYINTGVLLVSRAHVRMFQKPPREVDNFYEQTYLNLVRGELPLFPLDFRFNRMHPMNTHTGEPRLSSYIVHYAGYTADNEDDVLAYIASDIERWRSRGLV